jgi:DNA-binding NarL/FixJ family response regulator
MSDSQKTKVLIVEDHEITRLGLRAALDRVPELSVIGEEEEGQAGVKAAFARRPDVVLMDIGLPVLNGIDATRKIKEEAPEIRVIILTSHDSETDIFAAFAAGADGYCVKDIASDQLVMAIKSVCDGAGWIDPRIANRVLRAQTVQQPADPPLSQRELEVLKLLVEGLSNQKIADRLFLSVETVRTHVRHITEKMAVSDRTQAAVKAVRQGLV